MTPQECGGKSNCTGLPHKFASVHSIGFNESVSLKDKKRATIYFQSSVYWHELCFKSAYLINFAAYNYEDR